MAVTKTLASNSLAESMDRILDGGIVVDGIEVDVWARISLLNVELRAPEARLAGAGGVDNLRYAEAVGLTVKAHEA
jgi:hypothetical protein